VGDLVSVLFVVAFAAVAATAVLIHVLMRRSVPVADGSAGPFGGRTPPVAGGGSRPPTPRGDPNAWQSVIVSDLPAAEELLDQMEVEGNQDLELHVLGNSTFLVRWRRRG